MYIGDDDGQKKRNRQSLKPYVVKPTHSHVHALVRNFPSLVIAEFVSLQISQPKEIHFLFLHIMSHPLHYVD